MATRTESLKIASMSVNLSLAGRRSALDDRAIRTALRRRLQARHGRSNSVRIIEEVGLAFGSVRVDLAVINGRLHGYEIKSDRDTLARLPRQAASFVGPLDRITIVSGWRHVLTIMRSAPIWWGVILAEPLPSSGVRLAMLRVPSDNPSPDPLSLTSLLWKAELLRALERVSAVEGVRSSSKRVLQRRLVDSVRSYSALRRLVCSTLREREHWRPDAR